MNTATNQPSQTAANATNAANALLAQRIAAVNPARYAQTRNYLHGDVTQLSPYITHGWVSIPSICTALQARQPADQPLQFKDKIIAEFAWREFFQHVWRIQGDAIFKDMRPPIYAGAYANTLPDDIAQARTGVPAIDEAVHQLYATGYLHNHARMWLASYVVHLRKVHWHAGAHWMYAHLLDGDCASNYLSWQWVAGTFSSKPYVFNADNVAQFTPQVQHHPWHSEGTVIDQSYEALDEWARSDRRATAETWKQKGRQHVGATVPTTTGVPLNCHTSEQLASHVQGRAVRLVHPWSLSDTASISGLGCDGLGTDAPISVAWLCPAFHTHFQWSSQRWDWVLMRMAQLTPLMVVGDVQALHTALIGAHSVFVQDTQNNAYRANIEQLVVLFEQASRKLDIMPEAMLFPQLNTLCNSFTKYYQTVQKISGSVPNCL